MRDKPWVKTHQLPWPLIKATWERHWDMGKPVLLEKSPPNIIRTDDIVQHFQPVKFVIMVRNPYAHAEGLMRRNNWTATRAARFSMVCLTAQLENQRKLADTLVLTYESLAANPVEACRRLQAFLPELGELKANASFEVHSVDGVLNRPITDLNSKKIASLNRSAIKDMNAIYNQHDALFEHWGYRLMDPAEAPDTASSQADRRRPRLRFWRRGIPYKR